MGVFSKRLTLRICRIVVRLRSRGSCFLTRATSTDTERAIPIWVFTAFSEVP
jgi:hypothetical protein